MHRVSAPSHVNRSLAVFAIALGAFGCTLSHAPFTKKDRLRRTVEIQPEEEPEGDPEEVARTPPDAGAVAFAEPKAPPKPRERPDAQVEVQEVKATRPPAAESKGSSGEEGRGSLRTGKRKNLGTFSSREAAEKHERQIQFFKKH